MVNVRKKTKASIKKRIAKVKSRKPKESHAQDQKNRRKQLCNHNCGHYRLSTKSKFARENSLRFTCRKVKNTIDPGKNSKAWIDKGVLEVFNKDKPESRKAEKISCPGVMTVYQYNDDRDDLAIVHVDHECDGKLNVSFPNITIHKPVVASSGKKSTKTFQKEEDTRPPFLIIPGQVHSPKSNNDGELIISELRKIVASPNIRWDTLQFCKKRV